MGSVPEELITGPLAGLRIHVHLENRARQLVQSLNANQRSIAVVSDMAPVELLSSHLEVPKELWNEWLDTMLPEGIAISMLDAG